MNDIIKEKVPVSSTEGILKQHIVTIREFNYDSRFSKFQRLVDEAWKDFPWLTQDEIRIVHFGGMRYKGTWGIEFVISADHPIPDTYAHYYQTEYLL